MNTPRVSERDYIDFLVATPKVASACEAASCQPDVPKAPAHDAFSRFLARVEPDTATLWTVLDKPYAHKMGLVG